MTSRRRHPRWRLHSSHGDLPGLRRTLSTRRRRRRCSLLSASASSAKRQSESDRTFRIPPALTPSVNEVDLAAANGRHAPDPYTGLGSAPQKLLDLGLRADQVELDWLLLFRYSARRNHNHRHPSVMTDVVCN